MNYESGERQIVDRLNAHFVENGIDKYFVAALMPETEQDAKDFEALYPKGRIAVEYQESNYQPSSSLTVIKQDENVRFRLLFEAKKQRGIDGLFTMLEESKKALIGFRLIGSNNALAVAGSGKLMFDDIALPYIEFDCRVVNIQSEDPEDSDAIGGFFKNISFPNDQFASELSNEFK